MLLDGLGERIQSGNVRASAQVLDTTDHTATAETMTPVFLRAWLDHLGQTRHFPTWAGLILLSLATAACAPRSAPAPVPTPTRSAIDATLATLYQSFSFDKGKEPEWSVMRSLFLEGASFVDPISDAAQPRAIGVEAFITNFREAVENAPAFREGLRERIVVARVDHFGHVAHAYVTFEGFVPGEYRARTRGVDSIQLVRSGTQWMVASFTTQYEKRDLPLPSRFLSESPGT